MTKGKVYDRYVSAVKLNGECRDLWNKYYDLELESKETIKRVIKQKDKALQGWSKAEKKLRKARAKFEETMK